MLIGRKIDTQQITDYRISNLFRAILNVVDGKISKEDNIQGALISKFLFAQANFNYPLVHDLGRIVTHFVVLSKDQFADFKTGTIGPTQDRLYIQCDTPSTTADIFIWG